MTVKRSSCTGEHKLVRAGISLVVQWLRLRDSTAGGTGLILGLGTKIPHAAGRGQKLKTNKKLVRAIQSVKIRTENGYMIYLYKITFVMYRGPINIIDKYYYMSKGTILTPKILKK